MYVKLEEAKKHLLLDDSFKDDDLYILGLIDVAEDAVARNLNLKLDELAVDGEFTPPAVIHAILLLIGNLYANREPVSYSSVNKVPYTLKWLINTLNESIGKDNYKLEAKDYELHITINLVYTEAAEMLKTNLVKQIPANIMLDYKLETKANEFIGAVISSQDYINLNAIAFERKEDITIIQENNMGLVVSNMEYMNVDLSTDIILEDTILNADESIGSKVSRQDYIDLNITTEEKKENISINQNTNLGLQLASQDYIEIGGKD